MPPKKAKAKAKTTKTRRRKLGQRLKRIGEGGHSYPIRGGAMGGGGAPYLRHMPIYIEKEVEKKAEEPQTSLNWRKDDWKKTAKPAAAMQVPATVLAAPPQRPAGGRPLNLEPPRIMGRGDVDVDPMMVQQRSQRRRVPPTGGALPEPDATFNPTPTEPPRMEALRNSRPTQRQLLAGADAMDVDQQEPAPEPTREQWIAAQRAEPMAIENTPPPGLVVQEAAAAPPPDIPPAVQVPASKAGPPVDAPPMVQIPRSKAPRKPRATPSLGIGLTEPNPAPTKEQIQALLPAPAVETPAPAPAPVETPTPAPTPPAPAPVEKPVPPPKPPRPKKVASASPKKVAYASGHEAHMKKLEDAQKARVESKRAASARRKEAANAKYEANMKKLEDAQKARVESKPAPEPAFRAEMRKFRYKTNMETLEQAPAERQKRKIQDEATINQQIREATHRLQSSTHVTKTEAATALSAHQLPAHKLVLPTEYTTGVQKKEIAKAWEVNLRNKEKRDKTRMQESVRRQIQAQKDVEVPEWYSNKRQKLSSGDLTDREWESYVRQERRSTRDIENKIGQWIPSDQRTATQHVARSEYLTQGGGTFNWSV